MGQFRDRTIYTVDATGSITRPANTTAYATGDVISDVTGDAHYTFSNALKAGGKERGLSGTILSAHLISSANVAVKLDAELWLFHTDIAAVADNGLFAPTDTEMLTLLGIVDFPTASWKVGVSTVGAAGNAVVRMDDLGITIKGGRTLYGQLVARNAYIPVSGEVFTVHLVIDVR